MAALSTDRNTPRRDGETLIMGVGGAKKIYAGSLVALNKEGYAVPGCEGYSLCGLGRAEVQADNSWGSDGDVTVEVTKGVFRFDNHDKDTVTMADIGRDCYIVDDHTVAGPRGPAPKARGVAGKVYDVDASGVWVRFQ